MTAGPPLVVLTGPTGAGKSRLAIAVALAWREAGRAAEIVNADSMAAYRGMDIGTAKPSVKDRREVPHHLIDVFDIGEPASVAVFRDLARDAIADCRARGVTPVLVGGSALYIHAITDELDFPGTDAALRARLTAELAEEGAPAMYDRLRRLDPGVAAGIHPNNSRRVLRALEAIELTGGFRATFPEPRYAIPHVIQVGLDIPREVMDERIAARVEAMWEAGLPAEVERLLGQGLREAPTASRAIGYREAIAYLDGRMTARAAREATIIKTRQFSRKQLGWWRRDARIRWMAYDAGPSAVMALADYAPGPRM